MIDHFEGLSDNPNIDSLTKLVGLEKVTRLSEDFAGRRVFIPKNPGPDSPLAVSVGIDSAKKISQVYGGMEFEVPVVMGRRSKIMKLKQEGKGPTAIAREVGCTRRAVQKALDADEQKKQLNFFSPAE